MTRRTNQRTLVVISIVLMAFASPSTAKIIYVDANAPGPTHDGSSWENAYKHLQDALADANSTAKPVEVRVAQGIYTPDSNSADPNGSGDRTATFQLINGVTLKGGYAGFGEPDPNERNIEFYETILSGDLDGNDVVVDPCDLLDEPTRAENSYVVVFANSTDATSVLDGFTITACNGKSSSPPPPPPSVKTGGMYNLNADPTITNCTFSANATFNGLGSGMCNRESNPALLKCTFINNFDSAMSNMESSPSVTNCIFSGNTTIWWGGGMLNLSSSPALSNCIFSGNSSTGTDFFSGGGGMFNWENSSPTLANCIFSGNSAYDGGGMYNLNHSSPTLTNCIFSGNSSKGTDFQQSGGGGMYNYDHSSPTVTSCTFTDNSACEGGGGMHNRYYCSPKLINCTISSNHARVGGGMGDDSGDPTLTNCIITGNTARVGGGMYHYGSVSTLTNCIFIGNSAVTYGGGMYNSGSLRLINCILWSNTPEEIRFRGGCTPYINYSNVRGGWWGIGNIDTDLCFVDPGYWDPNGTLEDANDDFWVDGDYHLKSQAGRWDANSQSWIKDDVTSPCIDAGNPGCPLGDEPSPNGNRRNMGAYGGTVEASKSPAYWRSIADVTNDWIVDTNDLKVLADYWLQTSECIPSDFDRSQFVDFNDFATLGGQWHEKGPGPVITYDIGGCIPVDLASSALVESEPTRFTVTVEGRNIYFEDMMRANCCPEELDVQMTVEADLITIYEIEHTPMPCPCLCDFPIIAKFGPFEPGTYILEVYQDGCFIGATIVTIENG